VGNRTEQTQSTGTTGSSTTDTYTQSYNHDNQLTTTEITTGPNSGDSISYTYNANGHTETKTHTKNGTTQTTEYIYNHSERLIAVKIDGITESENSYNPYGQRIKKTTATGTTWYLYNGEGLAAEYSNDGTLIKEYQFTPYSPWMTKPLFQRTASGDVYYYQNDHLGTPQRLIARNGATAWEARYSAFGEAGIIVNTVENNLRFPGQYYDQATQLHHNYFRDYDPSVGRYVQSDPIGLAGGINAYGYVGGIP
jgi:RHS repeat-associated protein